MHEGPDPELAVFEAARTLHFLERRSMDHWPMRA